MFRTELEAAVQRRHHHGRSGRTPASRSSDRAHRKRRDGGHRRPGGGAGQFDFSHVLWYAGALIVIGALGLFTTVAFAAMGPSALTMTALAYGAGFIILGRFLWGRPGLEDAGRPAHHLRASTWCRWRSTASRRSSISGRSLMQDPHELWRLLRMAECELGLYGRGDHRRRRHCAPLLPVPLHRRGHGGRALVPLDGPDALGRHGAALAAPTSPGACARRSRCISASR